MSWETQQTLITNVSRILIHVHSCITETAEHVTLIRLLYYFIALFVATFDLQSVSYLLTEDYPDFPHGGGLQCLGQTADPKDPDLS